jgi:hypothetical protein
MAAHSNWRWRTKLKKNSEWCVGEEIKMIFFFVNWLSVNCEFDMEERYFQTVLIINGEISWKVFFGANKGKFRSPDDIKVDERSHA